MKLIREQQYNPESVVEILIAYIMAMHSSNEISCTINWLQTNPMVTFSSQISDAWRI